MIAVLMKLRLSFVTAAIAPSQGMTIGSEPEQLGSPPVRSSTYRCPVSFIEKSESYALKHLERASARGRCIWLQPGPLPSQALMALSIALRLSKVGSVTFPAQHP